MTSKELIQKFEGCRLEAYKDAGGIWTIGWGHTGDVKPDSLITQHQADAILDVDIDKHERDLRVLLGTTPVTPNQFAALTSFVFNVGVPAFGESTMLKRIREGKPAQAADEFLKWVFCGKRVLPGLARRRAAERALFLTP